MQAAIEPAGCDESLTLVWLGVIGPFVMVAYLARKLLEPATPAEEPA